MSGEKGAPSAPKASTYKATCRVAFADAKGARCVAMPGETVSPCDDDALALLESGSITESK